MEEIIEMDSITKEKVEESNGPEVFLDIPAYRDIVQEWERSQRFKGIIESKNVSFKLTRQRLNCLKGPF